MSPVSAERHRPSWMRKAEPFEFIGQRVSNAKGMNMYVCEPATGIIIIIFIKVFLITS